jgi:ABC-type lipoprotein release transport system permease subunit
MIYMPLRDLQEIAFREKQVTLFEIKLATNLPAGRLEAIKKP